MTEIAPGLSFALLTLAFFYISINTDREQRGLQIFFFCTGLLMAASTAQLVVVSTSVAYPGLQIVIYSLIVGISLMFIYVIWDALKLLTTTISPWKKERGRRT